VNAQRHFTGSSQKAGRKLDQPMVATASSVWSTAPENAIERLYRHSVEAASQFVEHQIPSMLWLAQRDLMPFPPLPRAEAEGHRIRPSCLLLLTGLLLLAGGDIAFADTAADANASYQRGDYATAIELFRSLAEQGDTAAQYAIGNMYDKGEGVLRDKNEAIKCGIGRPCMAMLMRYASSKTSVVRNSIREEKARYRASIASTTPATTMIC
jgi:hypothetical protein